MDEPFMTEDVKPLLTVAEMQMMEKSGQLVLTDDDLKQYKEGKVSERIVTLWQLKYDELRQIINDGNYTLMNKE